MAHHHSKRNEEESGWIAIFKRPVKQSEFNHLDNIANHFSGRIENETKGWPFEAESAKVYLEGYHLIGLVRFSYPKRLHIGFFPQFEYWKPVEVVPHTAEEFESPEGTKREWEYVF